VFKKPVFSGASRATATEDVSALDPHLSCVISDNHALSCHGAEAGCCLAIGSWRCIARLPCGLGIRPDRVGTRPDRIALWDALDLRDSQCHSDALAIGNAIADAIAYGIWHPNADSNANPHAVSHNDGVPVRHRNTHANTLGHCDFLAKSNRHAHAEPDDFAVAFIFAVAVAGVDTVSAPHRHADFN
jgi:hypothetical protein